MWDVSCVRLAQILGNLSHDSINRFLWREDYTPKDLFDEVAPQIELVVSQGRTDG